MNKFTFGILAMAATTAILASAPTAQAFILVQSVSGTATADDGTGSGFATGYVNPVFNKFNSGGILTDVKITLSFTNGIGTAPTVTVSNTSGQHLDDLVQ